MAFSAFNQAIELFNQIYSMRKEGKELAIRNQNAEAAFGSHRYRPHSLDQLVRETRFSKQEIQRLYRGIKQFCPTGMVDVETFTTIFRTLFPQGEPQGYAELVFMSFESGRKIGLVTFDEIVATLSVLFRGSDDEKLCWVFALYDSNRDGKLTRNDLLAITRSVYQILGRWTAPVINDHSFQNHCENIFKKMDINGDGEITCDEFLQYCKADQGILESINVLDTVI